MRFRESFERPPFAHLKTCEVSEKALLKTLDRVINSCILLYWLNLSDVYFEIDRR